MKRVNRYVIRVAMLFLIVLCQPRYVQADNDGFTTAQPISVNMNVEGVCNSVWDDEKYYQFTLTQAGVVNISFMHQELESGDDIWDFYLYDANRNEISGKYSGWQAYACDGNIGLPMGTYYIKVELDDWNGGTSGVGVPYTLNVNYTASGNWETEMNDGYLTADSIRVGDTTTGFLMDSGDQDYFKFTVDKKAYVSVVYKNTQLVEEGNETYIRLFNQDREKISFNSIWGTEKSVNLGRFLLDKGTYYIHIEDGFSYYNYKNSRPYTIKAYYTAPAPYVKSVKSTKAKNLTLSWHKTNNVSGYQVKLATNKGFTKNKKVVLVSGSKKVKKTISGLKRKKTYYVKVRAYVKVNGVRHYGPYSGRVKVKVK